METKTYESLLSQALALVPSDLDKREGSLIYTAVAPICALLAAAYTELAHFSDLHFPDTAAGEYLDRIAAQYGIRRKEAAQAVKHGEFTFSQDAEELPELTGLRFLCGGIAFTATEKLSNTAYYLTADEGGAAANACLDLLIPCEYVPALETASITSTVSYGTDREDDDSLRQRILSYLSAPAFCGNCSDYQNHLLAVTGIGAAKVFSAEDAGPGCVTAVVGNADGKAVSAEVLAKATYCYADENPASVKPIGHTVTVKTCQEVEVPVSLAIAVHDGAAFSTVQPLAEQAVRDAIREMGFENPEVSVAGIISRVLAVSGVRDVTDVQLCGKAENFRLQKTAAVYEAAVPGAIVITEEATADAV